MVRNWKDIAESERAKLKASIPDSLRLSEEVLKNLPLDVSNVPETCGLLTKEQIELTQLDATELRDRIASGKVTAVEAVKAIGGRAAIAQQLTAPLTELFLDEAIKQAEQLDAHFKQTGKVVGPLHGLPISIKNQIAIKGHDTASSFTSWVGKMIAEEDSAVVRILREAGAVFYCETNMPQTIMHLETNSYMGRTVNPYNTGLAAGGSSGGESSLIAMKGSPLGVGTDIGGSVRSPAAACGLYSLRPTAYRVPYGGIYASCAGAETVLSVAGPLARSARDVVLFMSTVLAAQPWLVDPLIVELPWRPAEEPAKLRVGVLRHNGFVQLQPPLRRALDTVVEKIRDKEGIEIVEYEPYKHDEGLDIVRSLYFVDGAKDVKSILAASEEPAHPLTQWVLDNPLVKEHDIQQLWKLCLRRDAYRTEYRQHWKKFNIDVLLCPVGPGPAPAHDTAKYWGYTAQWNLLDYPAAVFPTGIRASAKLDPVDANFKSLSDDDQINHDAYKPELFENAPLSLQLVATRWGDERLMAAVQKIDRINRA